MSRQIICTVGTSLLTNRDGRPWAGWNPRKGDLLPRSEAVDAWLAQAEPIEATAETNTLRALELSEIDSLALLHSDTAEGQFCAERLAKYYRSRGYEVSLERIGKLGYGAALFTSGLKALVDVTLRLVRAAKERQREPVLCATGGFKAEIAFLNLLGALLEIEVVYIHEQHRELVRLPRLPLSWNAEFVTRHQGFFSWIDEEPRSSREVESRLKGCPELRSLIEQDEDGHSYLTAAGSLLFKVAQESLGSGPRATWPACDPSLPKAKNKVSAVEHHRPLGWERFVDGLCDIDCVCLVRYDPTACSGPRVKIVDSEAGILAVRFEKGNTILPLLIETTARGERQCELVAEHLRTRR